MSSEVSKMIKRFQGINFPCDCGKDSTLKAIEFDWYPHSSGLVDKNGNKQWLYWTCPYCKYQWAWHKIKSRLERFLIIKVVE